MICATDPRLTWFDGGNHRRGSSCSRASGAPDDRPEFEEGYEGRTITRRFIKQKDGGFPDPYQRIADLVAASGAFPVAFNPKRFSEVQIKLEAMQDQDGDEDSNNNRAVEVPLLLADGGITDNLGLQLLLDANDLASARERDSSEHGIPKW